ncbi:MAG: tetratricopeptide repeat protein [Turicibacter sp.]|nr:tetratricopeptide repeat protein [Turicibacter sp.]
MDNKNYQYFLNEKAVANYYLDLGNAEKAFEHFDNAFQTSFGESDLDLMLELAFLHDELGNTSQAIRLFQKMIKVDPEFPTSYYGLATIYDNEENYEKAVFYYQKTLALDPAYEAAHFFLANIYDELGEFDKALEHYEKTLELDPDYFYAYINIGCIYEGENNNLKAYSYFYKAYKADPINYMALFNLGVVCRKLGQIKDAIKYYEKALVQNKEYHNTYLNLAILYKEEYKDYEKSVELYTEGLKHNPEVSVLYYNRACVHALLGHEHEAIEDLKVSVQLSPTLKDYMQKDEELAEVRKNPDYQRYLALDA